MIFFEESNGINSQKNQRSISTRLYLLTLILSAGSTIFHYPLTFDHALIYFIFNETKEFIQYFEWFVDVRIMISNLSEINFKMEKEVLTLMK
jgi:hypothetical protein